MKETKLKIKENKLKQKAVELSVLFSQETESTSIRKTLLMLKWLYEHGYKVMLPASILEMFNSGEKVSDDEIRKVVSTEYKKEDFEKIAEGLGIQWKLEREEFMKKLSTLRRPVCNSYKIFLTKYGTSGTYHFPDTVNLRIYFNDKNGAINLRGVKPLLKTIKHEMVHLTIEDLIKKHDIDHWTKERLVDLIEKRFLQLERDLQRDPKEAEKVSKIFDEYFPDIEKVIIEVSKISS